MATSRTGTAKWKAIVAKRRRQAQRDGIHNCPRCGIPLDYTQGHRARNSVEVDHIIPAAQGGTDTFENSMVLCGKCNRELGGKQGVPNDSYRGAPPAKSMVPATSRKW